MKGDRKIYFMHTVVVLATWCATKQEPAQRNMYAYLVLELTIVLQWIPGHCGVLGKKGLMNYGKKKGTTIELITQQEVPYNSRKTHLKNTLREVHQKHITRKISERTWRNAIMQIPDGPRRVAVAEFRLTTEHDYLAKHLCRIGIRPDPYCLLCCLQVEMDREHLQQWT